MTAINAPSNPDEIELPNQAKGNPVYEQTRQDMPLWCCGRNCGRNARITVFILGTVGIVCSSIVCVSPHYFSFVSLRKDTFCDDETCRPSKEIGQPKPFVYATEANVGLFRYEILEVYEYPWPPEGQRELFDAMHKRELDRLAAADKTSNSKDGQSSGSTSYETSIINRLLPNKFPDEFYDDDDRISVIGDVDGEDDDISNSSQNVTHQNDTMDIILTRAPSETLPGIEDIPIDQVPDVIPGSNEILSHLPASSPTSSPTAGNPNDLVDVEIGVVKAYPAGVEFDSLFTNGQMGAMWAPILATIGLAFSLIEFCCCIYKCSWLPTALFLYAAFMLQLMTMFLFMSEDFCKYGQDCALGFSGLLSAVAVIAYMICQTLVCMTPRPPPIYNLCKKPPVRKKKKKKRRNEFDESESLAENEDGFGDEPNNYDGYVDPYDDQDPYDATNDEYDDNDGYNDGYNDEHDNGYNDGYDNEDQEPYGDEGQAYGDHDEDVDEDDYDYEETVGTSRRRKK